MKLAVISDIHDNLLRLEEALSYCRHQKIEACICCGDIGQLDGLEKIANTFRNVYLALGNADYNLLNKTGLFPENIKWSEDVLNIEVDGLVIAIVHHDYKAKELAKLDKFDVIFYGHTHTPWEKKIGRTLLINPGETAGQFGPASFAIFDTDIMKAELKLLK
jgi:putative phosphoesterase